MRDMPESFGWKATLTLPLPLPDEPSGNVIHDTVDEALHVQPDGVSTARAWVPPTTFKLDGETRMLHVAPA